MPPTKVLVIEDDRSLAEVLAYNLKAAGYDVLVATDGQDGLLKAQTKSPDIVVLDLMLPVVDGLDVCRRLRADHSTKELLDCHAHREGGRERRADRLLAGRG